MTRAIMYFTSPTCAPCKTLGPKLETLCAERGIELQKIDISTANGALAAQKVNVQSVPVLIIGNTWVSPGQARIKHITKVVEEELG